MAHQIYLKLQYWKGKLTGKSALLPLVCNKEIPKNL